MKEPKKGKEVGNILIGQFLLGLLITVAQAFYSTHPKWTLVVIYLLILGIIYFSLKGLKGLWK